MLFETECGHDRILPVNSFCRLSMWR